MAKTSLEKARRPEVTPWRSFFTDPFQQMERMRREMDRVWGDIFSEMPTRKGELMELGEWAPAFDLMEKENELIVRAEVPGMSPKDIDISLHDNTLRIRGEKKQEFEEKDQTYHYMGRSYGTFARTIPLPAEVKGDKVKAAYKDGVLTITLPKSEEAKQKEVKIKVETP